MLNLQIYKMEVQLYHKNSYLYFSTVCLPPDLKYRRNTHDLVFKLDV